MAPIYSSLCAFAAVLALAPSCYAAPTVLSSGIADITEKANVRPILGNLGPYGGNSGGEFNDYRSTGVLGIRSIQVRSEARIDKLTTTYHDGTTREHGGNTGTMRNVFTIKDPDDWLTEVYVCHGARVNQLRFKTTKGVESQTYGGSGSRFPTDACYTMRVPDPEKHAIVSFFGRAGSELDQIGALYQDIVTCSEVTEEPVGSWVVAHSSGGALKITSTYGTEYAEGVTNTNQFTKSASIKTSAGFKFLGAGVEASITGQSSAMVSATMENSLKSTSSTAFTSEFPVGAVVWEWQMEYQGACGRSVSKINSLVDTPSFSQPPCCPPNMFMDPSNPLGECAYPNVSICAPSSGR